MHHSGRIVLRDLKEIDRSSLDRSDGSASTRVDHLFMALLVLRHEFSVRGTSSECVGNVVGRIHSKAFVPDNLETITVVKIEARVGISGIKYVTNNRSSGISLTVIDNHESNNIACVRRGSTSIYNTDIPENRFDDSFATNALSVVSSLCNTVEKSESASVRDRRIGDLSIDELQFISSSS